MAAPSSLTRRLSAPAALSGGVALLVSVLSPPSAAAQSNAGPVDGLGARLASLRSDPPPPRITRGRHYVVSDERRHDLFRPAVAGLGGVFVGVGSHQNYVMAGWAAPDALVVVDFDQVIIDLHRVYRAIFLNAASPEAFREAWGRSAAQQQHVRAWVVASTPEGPFRRAALEAYRVHRPNVRWGLDELVARMQEQATPTFLDDAAQYEIVRRLFLTDRVVSLRGDFTGTQTLHGLSEALREQGLTVRVLYLSNVEQYFAWSQGRFRDNMLGLPFDERSVVIRTYGFGRHRTADHNYRYFVQPGLRFHDWLRVPTVRSVKQLLRAEEATEIRGFYRLTSAPQPNSSKG